MLSSYFRDEFCRMSCVCGYAVMKIGEQENSRITYIDSLQHDAGP